MPRPYSADLRRRVLRACERGRLSRARIAAMFGVGATTLFRWQQQARDEGRREAKPPRGGPAPRLDDAALAAQRGLVAETNALTLAEYAEWTLAEYAECLAGRTSKHADGVPGAAQAGLGAQKTLRAAEQDRPELAR